MPIGTPQGNLDIKNATLRTSNLETQNIKIGSIFVGTGNSLEETANVGNTTSNTIQFTNTHTAFTTTGNVSVGGELTVTGTVTGTAATFSGDVTVDSTTFHVDSTNNRVGIGTTSPSSSLHVNLGNAAGEQHIRATQTSLANSTAGIRFGDSTWDAFIDHSHGTKDLMNFGFYPVLCEICFQFISPVG